MPFRIVRNDITKMNTEAIVNTANANPVIGPGCDSAIYKAAGREKLLEYRKVEIGSVPEGEAFITPGFALPAKYIIHAVSPLYRNGSEEEEAKLRSCYKKSLELAKKNGIKSIAFPLISTGSFGYPKEEGMRIAVDEINAFLLGNDMDISLVVFDKESTKFGKRLDSKLESYIDRHYVAESLADEYSCYSVTGEDGTTGEPKEASLQRQSNFNLHPVNARLTAFKSAFDIQRSVSIEQPKACAAPMMMRCEEDDIEELEEKLKKRLEHTSDTFSEYLLYLIEQKGMKNSDVYNKAVIDKRYFSKLKNNKDFHPEKLKALCLCVGAELSLDETKDLLARAGYALSPCDLTDIIFSFYIENKHYNVIDIDIQLEEHGLPCIIE